MHRVADVVQIPRPWIRSEEREYRRQPRPHSPSFPCDPRLCNDSRARCAATIFFCSPRLVCLLALALALARPRPRPFSPSPLALALIARHRHRRRFITSTRRRSTPTHRHLRFFRSSSARSRIFGIAASLPPSSVTWGTSPNSARRHRSALHCSP